MEFGKLDTLLQSIKITEMTKEQLQQARKDLESVSAEVKSRLKTASALRKEAMKKRKQLVDQEKKDARVKRAQEKAAAKQIKSFKHAELCNHVGVKSASVFNPKSKLPQIGKWKLTLKDTAADSFSLTRRFNKVTGEEQALPKNAKADQGLASDVFEINFQFNHCKGTNQVRLAGLNYYNLVDQYVYGECVHPESGNAKFFGRTVTEVKTHNHIILQSWDLRYPPDVEDREAYARLILGDRALLILERLNAEVLLYADRRLSKAVLPAVLEMKDITTQPIFGIEHICKLKHPLSDDE